MKYLTRTITGAIAVAISLHAAAAVHKPTHSSKAAFYSADGTFVTNSIDRCAMQKGVVRLANAPDSFATNAGAYLLSFVVETQGQEIKFAAPQGSKLLWAPGSGLFKQSEKVWIGKHKTNGSDPEQWVVTKRVSDDCKRG